MNTGKLVRLLSKGYVLPLFLGDGPGSCVENGQETSREEEGRHMW